MKIEMREQKHLWIKIGLWREIIIDEENKDVRLSDGHHTVKVRWEAERLKDILVDDVFIAQGLSA